MGGKIAPIRQETQAEEAAAWDGRSCRNNDQKKIITVNGNLKWCAQEKINNKQNPAMQEKDGYNDVVNKYIHKIDDQRRKLLILYEQTI